MTAASSVEMSNWSELPPELIRSIAAKTADIADYVRLRAVCKPWWSASAEPGGTIARPQVIPWLLLPYAPVSSSRSFFSLSTRETFTFDLPHLRGNLTYGSSHGWLVTVDEALGVALLHLISGRLVRLPPVTPFPDFATFRFDRRGEEFIYRRRGGVGGKVNYDMIWHILFFSVFMSPSPSSSRGDHGAVEEGEYVVTMTSCLSPRFLCYRSVDPTWTLVDSTLTCGVDSITRHGDKLFLAGIDGCMVVCDLYPHFRAELVNTLTIPGDFHCRCYLGTVRGKLLLAVDSMRPREGEKEKKISVFELDDVDGSDESSREKKKKKTAAGMRWAKVEDVGDCTLLLTENHRITAAAGRGALGCGGDYVCFSAVRREVEGRRVETEVVQQAEEWSRVLACDWVTEMEALGPAWFAPALF